ncbi:MAG: type II toxin-antitoxin system VapC family toxin [Acetobacteraceae bacterium]
MVIDSSAVVAILFDEADWQRYVRAIEAATTRLISAATRVELAFVVEGRKREIGKVLLERFLRLTGAEIVAVTPQHAEIAVEAFRRFGKGRHRAGLNMGDCFSYALAAATNQPLLFKGGDFVHTDLHSALPA